MRKKDGSDSTKVHVVQISGVSDSGQDLPSFKMFDLNELGNVSMINEAERFVVSEQYNPEWPNYTCVLAKI
jgi:hypothetical protein